MPRTNLGMIQSSNTARDGMQLIQEDDGSFTLSSGERLGPAEVDRLRPFLVTFELPNAAPKQRNTGMIVAIVAAVLLVLVVLPVAWTVVGVGSLRAIGAVDQKNAEAEACTANRKLIENAEKAWAKDYFPGLGQAPVEQLVEEGYLDGAPVCPSGGEYTVVGEWGSCSVHGDDY